MLLLLPPSETKRDGGAEGSRLDLGALAFPELAAPRRSALAALARLSRSITESTRALGLGATQRHEIDRNRAVRRSPTMPAIDRYTGVLFDALEGPSLSAGSRQWLDEHVLVQSALLGLTRALDPIPAYRLSASTRLPGLRLAAVWAPPIQALSSRWDDLVLDLRSEAYSALGPVPQSVFVRVVTRGVDGEVRALNHWNKHAKGEFTRMLANERAELDSTDDVIDWARERGLEVGMAGGELRLVV